MLPPLRLRGGYQCRCTVPAAKRDVQFYSHWLTPSESYLVVLEEFKNGKNNVVDVAEAGCFALLCVMESISSMNKMHGAFSMACSNNSLSLPSDSPDTPDTTSVAANFIKGSWSWPAMALANRVLPQPGGP